MPCKKAYIGLSALQAPATSCAHCWAACSSLCSSEMPAAGVHGSCRGLRDRWEQVVPALFAMMAQLLGLGQPPTSVLVPLLLSAGWPAASAMLPALLGLCLPVACAKVPYFLAVPAPAAMAVVAALPVQAPRAASAVV